MDCLRGEIEEKGVTPEELRLFLLNLPVSSNSNSSKRQKLTLLSDNQQHDLEKCATITAIFTFLRKCTSFLNYDIYQSLVENYNISIDQEKMKYPDHLKDFIEKHSIEEFAKINPQLKTKTDSKELTLKFDIETTCSLARVAELETFIANILELNPSALELVDIAKGCVIVTFLIPASMADAIFTPDTVFTSEQEDELREASVLWLKCNGYTFHFGKTTVHTESPGNLMLTQICNFRNLYKAPLFANDYRYSGTCHCISRSPTL